MRLGGVLGLLGGVRRLEGDLDLDRREETRDSRERDLRRLETLDSRDLERDLRRFEIRDSRDLERDLRGRESLRGPLEFAEYSGEIDTSEADSDLYRGSSLIAAKLTTSEIQETKTSWVSVSRRFDFVEFSMEV